MRLSKSTINAVRILIECAQAGSDLVKVAELSERLDITQQNTFKIVHLLSRAGFVKATRGRYGGVQLAKPAKDIRLGKVVRAMEAYLVGGAEAGAIQNAGFESLVDSAFHAFMDVLNNHSLDQMAKAQGQSATLKPRKPVKARKPIRRRLKAKRASQSGASRFAD